MTRILIYSHDTYGLGNIRRMLTIAESFVGADPAVSVLILTGSPMLHAFRLPDRIDYVKLPCLVRTDNGHYDVKHLAISPASTRRMRSAIIANAAAEFDPDIVLVDKKPLGVSGELYAALEILSRRETPPIISLILRDIIDAPHATRAVWDNNNYHQTVRKYYDTIYLVGQKAIFDLAQEYAFPADIAEKLVYTGYIRRSRGKDTPSNIRTRLGIANEKIVLVQAGGGGDGDAMMTAYLDALSQFELTPPFFTWIISGPEASRETLRKLQGRAAEIPLTFVQSFTDDMNACVNASDYVVSMGGYNSVCEILSLEKPALVIPRIKPVEEQWVRAKRFADLGCVAVLHPDHMTAVTMQKAVADLLRDGARQLPARDSIDLDGLKRLTTMVLNERALPHEGAAAVARGGAK